MKTILGLDLGTNSIGWALVQHNFESKEGKIVGVGSRIIPMSQDILGKFESGNSVSQTADRTRFRGVRRIHQRSILRRERLHRVLNVLGFLPEHYASAINFSDRPGQFKPGLEVKLNYKIGDNGKYEFLFKDSFREMLADFNSRGITNKVPYDWTLYYLRKKALTNKITKEELAWVLLSFNQKRGYYQLRGEELEENDNKQEEFVAAKVVDVVADDDTGTKGRWYSVILENNLVYRRQSKEPLNSWIGQIKEFIVTTQLDAEGNPKRNKDGEIARSFRAVDSEKDWIAIKTKTENDLINSGKTVGEYIYDALLEMPSQKIRGKLIRTIERRHYKEELLKILQVQQQFHEELRSNELLAACAAELYPNNEVHRKFLEGKDFTYLFVEDIIFYQRPLKSQKSSVANCSYEYRVLKNKEGVFEKEYLKVIPKSNPLFQEFRLWQFIANLKIYQRIAHVNGSKVVDWDVTLHCFSSEEEWGQLFDFLNSRKDISQKQLIDYLVKKGKLPKSEKANYRWNYVEDKAYPCNETRSSFISRLKKLKETDPEDFLTKQNEFDLWHLIYSITDKQEFEKALATFASKHGLDKDLFVQSFVKFPRFKSEYGAYSAKAIKKLLPLMRRGQYWRIKDVSDETKTRIDAILERLETINFDGQKVEEIADDDIPKQVLKSFININRANPYGGLNTFQACYAVYNRHSESEAITCWKSPEDIDHYLNQFRQHSLRNPIVEQVVTETLRVVRDIWKFYGAGQADFFDEIHLELGRELKNPAEKRKAIARRNVENENTNERIIKLLIELNESGIADVRPYSPSHQELLKIYEEGVYQNPDADFTAISFDEIEKIRRNASPSAAEITRYKLWLEQGYVSPYTGQPIQLSRLFSPDYQIEHIIPQSRYFDDSLSNKVICESEVNQLKGNQTGYEFIKNEKGGIVELAQGKKVRLFTLEEYENHCSRYFSRNPEKLRKLLSLDIPKGFIERQMNDSRYISKVVKGLLSNVVRHDDEPEVTAKNLLPLAGSITARLRRDWGLEDKWNELVAPRFQRLNELTGTENFGYFDKSIHAFRCIVPDELRRGFSKKRIDHRHHALDALVIACTTRNHVHYLNALSANNENHALKSLLLQKNENNHFTKNFLLPWKGFPAEAQKALETMVVSFKQNLRVINKTTNKYYKWVEQDGALKKLKVPQTKGDSWAIRKPLHKDTVSGEVQIRTIREVSFNQGVKQWESLVDKDLKQLIKKRIAEGQSIAQISKYFKQHPYPSKEQALARVKIYTYTQNATASRVALSDKFTRKKLEQVTDSGIRKILERHLANYVDEKGKERFDLAFSPEGIESLNKNIVALNNGRFHHPIYKVRLYEEGQKFPVGIKGNKAKKYVEAAKGTNLFFAVYYNNDKQKREYETIALNKVIEHQKWRATLPHEEREITPPVPLNAEKGRFLFALSPNDLVYVPSEEEQHNPGAVDFDNLTKEQAERIYKMVSCTGNECHFVPSYVASLIKAYDAKSKTGELGSLNKSEVNFEGRRIKEFGWKIELDRLGKIVRVLY